MREKRDEIIILRTTKAEKNRIYEKMLAGGETLEPRHQLYYGRELYYHQRYPETEAVLVEFLKNTLVLTET